MQGLKRTLAIDILVITCHVIPIPSVMLFSCLKIKHEGISTAHSVTQMNKCMICNDLFQFFLMEIPKTGSATHNSKCSVLVRNKVNMWYTIAGSNPFCWVPNM